MPTVKERMKEVIQSQPDDASYEEIFRELAFERMVDGGWRIFVKGGFCPAMIWSGGFVHGKSSLDGRGRTLAAGCCDLGCFSCCPGYRTLSSMIGDLESFPRLPWTITKILKACLSTENTEATERKPKD